jgi:hypothetical protein
MTDRERQILEQVWDKNISAIAAKMRSIGEDGLALVADMRASIAAWEQQQNGGETDD